MLGVKATVNFNKTLNISPKIQKQKILIKDFAHDDTRVDSRPKSKPVKV
jgi:hypothetical protein